MHLCALQPVGSCSSCSVSLAVRIWIATQSAYMVPWANVSLPVKRHRDRFIRYFAARATVKVNVR